ncbi:penicillin-binding protein [Fervidibacillus halotolerans]|uniref:serine-type D-Ala-D-Ala carboxypeptidase n=1 Tax=Fervidibacillus halotolerans TaxID=2980027 RepID=A0A9E8M1B1_9BACI|nr:penicillin-binding protein [Fervidibacillus halotolerans]WAA13688.1 penicillin-binding protein [Fervidibacillus halotolerans]
MKRPSMNRRALLLFFLFSVLFFTLAYRFFAIQLTGQADGEVLAKYAEKKYGKMRILEGKRGSILTRNGEPLAINTMAYKLVAVLDPSVTPENAKTPNHVVDPENTAKELAKYIPMDEKDILNRLQLVKEGYFQVEFGEAGRNLSYETKEKIESLNLPGILFIRESKRAYPNGIFASHLLGFALPSNESGEEKLVGQIGLEKTLNNYLEGKNGKIEYKSDRWGLILPYTDAKIIPPENGDTVYVTIDKKIQTFLENAMSEVDEVYSPVKMMGIVADAKTGAILAMAQRPTFDPNTREGIDENWQNIVVETAFEPGSTMKVFTLAAAIEEGVFHPNETFMSGSFTVKGSKPIRDHNYTGWGEITFLEGIQKSSNVGVSYLVEKMGTDVFRHYLDLFHFGQPTNIGLANEASGTIQFQWERDKYATSYGQGSSVTALQLIQGMTAITNNGKMMYPYVVEKIVDEEGKMIKGSDMKEVGTPISEKTAKQVREILETTVTEVGATGNRFQIDGYDVGGKTGTAQIYEPGVGYLTGWENYIFSFIGFAPVDDPQLIVYVMVQQPDLDEEKYEAGSVPVSMIFNPVMKKSLQYLNIEPDDGITPADVSEIPDLTGSSVQQALNILKDLKLEPIIIGNGSHVTSFYPEEGTHLLEGEKVLIGSDGTWMMPDLTGWSLRDVLKFASLTNIQMSYSGTGYVINQSLEKGTVISSKSRLTVELEDPLNMMKTNDQEESNSLQKGGEGE